MFKKIGVELGLHSIKIVNTRNSNINLSEEYLISYENKKEYISEIKRAITEFTKKSGEKWVSISFAVRSESLFREDSIFIGEFEIPEIDKKVVRRAVLNELQAQSEVDLKRYSVLTKMDLVNNYYKGRGFGLDKGLIQDLEDIGKINWKIERIEMLGESLAKLVNPGEVTAIISLDMDDISIYYVELGQLKAVKRINIESELEIFDEIETKEMEYSTYQISDETLMSIKDQIINIESTYNLELNKIYISGSLSNKPGITHDVNTATLIATERISKHKEVVNEIDSGLITMEAYQPAEAGNEDDDLDFSIFAGPYGVDNSVSEFNFGHQRKLSINIDSVLVSILTGLVILNIGSYAVNNRYSKLITEVSSDMAIVQEHQTKIENELQSLQEGIRSDKEKISDIDSILNKKIYLSDILFTLSKEAPVDVKIGNVKTKEGYSMIKGYSKNYKDIAYLSMALEKYGTVEIEEIDKSKEKIKIENRDEQLEREFTIILKHGSGRLNRE